MCYGYVMSQEKAPGLDPEEKDCPKSLRNVKPVIPHAR